ncbi:MAG: hypothetical protein AABY87_04425 [bacterium]
MYNQRDFFQLFINVILGLVLITLVQQFFNPIHYQTLFNVSKDIVLQNVNKISEDKGRQELIEKKLPHLIDTAWKEAIYDNDPSLDNNKNQIGLFVASLRKLIAREINGDDKDLFGEFDILLKDKLSAIASIRKLLIFAVFFFVIKYVHESTRIDNIIFSKCRFSTPINALFFAARILMLIFIVLLASFITGDLKWWLIILIFGGFIIQDIALLINFEESTSSPVTNGEHSNCIWHFVISPNITYTIIVWVILDVFIMIFGLGFFIPKFFGYNNIIVSGYVYFIMLLLQIAVPYLLRPQFYFSENYFPNQDCKCPFLE